MEGSPCTACVCLGPQSAAIHQSHLLRPSPTALQVSSVGARLLLAAVLRQLPELVASTCEELAAD